MIEARFTGTARVHCVAVSCNAGYGRTGTILACYLVADGRTAPEAIDELIAARPVADEIRRVPEQVDAIVEFARRVKSGSILF